MNESGFNIKNRVGGNADFRQSIGDCDGRYIFFKTRRYGKLHFEKRVADRYLNDILTVEALRKEFEIGYGLEHQGIVKYLAYENNSIFEEYIDGCTLREMLDNRDKRLRSPGFLQQVCRQILNALEYLHRHDVVHLDLKPENVMVSNIGNVVKLIDLGSARNGAFDNTEGYTPGYMAPEQRGDFATDVRTDIYLVGKLMQELAEQAGATELWRPFVEKATNPTPDKRFADAPQVLAAIPIEKDEEVKRGDRGERSERRGDELTVGRSKRVSGKVLMGVVIAAVIIIVALVSYKSIADFASGKRNGESEAVGDAAISKGNAIVASDEFHQASKLIQGIGVAQDEAEGMRLMMSAAEHGDAMAQCYIGLMYRDGCATLQRDASKSLFWIRKAAEQGNDVAIEEMGYKYYEGLGVEQDYAEAMKWLKQAAEKGKASAYSSIGIMYRDGEGVAPDFDKAEENFKKGASAGNSYSAYLLARLYGHYMKPNKREEALEWYQKASEMGSYRATEYLKKAYTEGDPEMGITPDAALATKYSVRLESSEAN
ncbi:MAG: protein kinase [Muribaculaceae bacterium]|nr:protein kinase [Muribaculaceae bacterium]